MSPRWLPIEEINGLVIPDSINNEQVCRLLKELSAKRSILHLCNKAIAGLDRNADSEEVIQSLQHESTDILRSSSFLLKESGVVEMDDWIKEIQDEIDSGERGEDEFDAPPTGMPELDAKMKGLQDINVISAPTGHGKSMLALNWAVNIARNKNFEGKILYLNYEMNQKQLARRVLAIASGVTYDEIYTRRFLTKSNAERYSAARDELLERKNNFKNYGSLRFTMI